MGLAWWSTLGKGVLWIYLNGVWRLEVFEFWTLRWTSTCFRTTSLADIRSTRTCTCFLAAFRPHLVITNHHPRRILEIVRFVNSEPRIFFLGVNGTQWARSFFPLDLGSVWIDCFNDPVSWGDKLASLITRTPMASRNRNRPGFVKEDADEERSLWGQIRTESKRIDSLVVCSFPVLTSLLLTPPILFSVLISIST